MGIGQALIIAASGFLVVFLMLVLLWVIIGKLGMAIGVLITLIGIGNMAIGYGAKQKQKEQELHDRMFNKGSESRTSTQEPEHE